MVLFSSFFDENLKFTCQKYDLFVNLFYITCLIAYYMNNSSYENEQRLKNSRAKMERDMQQMLFTPKFYQRFLIFEKNENDTSTMPLDIDYEAMLTEKRQHFNNKS